MESRARRDIPLWERWTNGAELVGSGKKVRVTFDWDDPEAYDIGYLEDLTKDGEVSIRHEDGTITFAWPFLDAQVIEPPIIEEDPAELP